MVVSQDLSIAREDHRPLAIRATYPKGELKQGEKLPVFIFSHGAFGNSHAYDPLVSYIARHGYVVLQPTHIDAVKFVQARNVDNPMSFSNWDDRPKEISYIIDNLGMIAGHVPALRPVMDSEKVAVGGHSFGAHTSQLLGGMTIKRRFNFTNDKRTSFRDDRVMAFVNISPYGTGDVIDDKSYKTMYRPTLFISGGNDITADGMHSAEWRQEPYRFASPRDKYLLYIDDAFHGFGGIGDGFDKLAENPAHLNTVRSSVVAFLDAYVKDDEDAKSWLSSSKLAAASNNLVRMTSRESGQPQD